MVTAAILQDREGAHRLLALLRERFSTISLVWADDGYAGRLIVWAQTGLRLPVTFVKRTDNTPCWRSRCDQPCGMTSTAAPVDEPAAITDRATGRQRGIELAFRGWPSMGNSEALAHFLP
ncbi:hypothetical protein ACPZ19_50935 [Amycolatopsis lurida]